MAGCLLTSALCGSAFAQTNVFPSAGNVGIGTTNPSAKLHIQNGDIALSFNNGIFIPGYNRTELLRVAYDNVNGWEDFVKFNVPGNSGSAGVEMRIASGGGGKFIFSGGNVGIGTTTPGRKLEVNSDLGVTAGEKFIVNFTQSTGQNGLFLGYRANGSTVTSALIRADNNLPITLGTSATNEAVTVLNSGNVGIGTTSPVSKLHVHGNYANDGTGGFTLDATDNGDPETYVLRINPFVLGAAKVGYQFQTKSAVGGTNVPLVFDNFGNVGIGTTNPADKLQVVTPATFGVNGTVVNSYPIARFTVASGAERGLEIGAPTGGVSSPVFLKVHGTSSRFALLNENDVEMLTALTTGNVGIGTPTPTHKLAVNGTIRAKEVIVDTGWADYVFADDYRLAPLSEVESHIRQKKHLPGIPSAAEVAEHGVSMGEMQAKLLAKVEELTLHLIEQSKMLQAQQGQMGRQQQEIMSLRAEVVRLSAQN